MAISNYGMLIGGVSHYENFHRIPKLSSSSNTIFHQMKLKWKWGRERRVLMEGI